MSRPLTMRLAREDLFRATTAGLERLARSLGLRAARLPGDSDGMHRGRLVQRIQRWEAEAARGLHGRA